MATKYEDKHAAGGDGVRPHVSMEKVDAHSPPETMQLIAQAGVAKARLPWVDLIVKSFLGGMFISLGGLFDLVVAGGATGLRANNPSIATLIAAFTFPIGFVLVILTNTELVTSNMFIMVFSTLQRKTTWYDLARNWIVSYVLNIAGALFFAGILAWWSDTLESDAQSTYAMTGAAGRVNVNWAYNFTRGIGCNWLVGLAYFLSTSSKDNISKIFGIWIPIWAFVALGYQHCIANYFLIPVGMFYGSPGYGVGKFIYQSCIPVTLGNIVGGSLFVGVAFWFLYGRDETLATHTGQPLSGESKHNGPAGTHGKSSGRGGSDSDETVNAGEQADGHTLRNRGARGDGIV